MLGDKIQKIEMTAAANGLAVHRNFNVRYIASHSYFRAPEILADQIADDLLKICDSGVNSGFNGSMKSAISKLTSLMVDLTKVRENDVKAYNKCAVQRDKVMKSLELRGEEVTEETGIKASIKKYIDTSVKAIDTLEALNSEENDFCTIDEKQIKRFNESKEKFEELLKALDKVSDVSSKDAVAYSNSVIKCILDWREAFSERMCTPDTVKKLDEAIELLNKWAQNVKIVSKRERAKETEFVKYEEDDVGRLSECTGTFETLQVFKDRMDEKARDIEESKKSLNEYDGQLLEVKNALINLENDKKQIAINLKNTGDVQAANLAAADLKRRKNELENKYREISAAIKRSQALNADITAQEKIYSRLKTVYDKVMTYKKDPAMLCIITNGVNFTSLAKMFRGVFDSETVDNALKDIVRINTTVNELKGMRIETAQKLTQFVDIADSVLNDYVIEEEEKEEIVLESKNGMSADLLSILGELEGADLEEKEEEKQTNKILDELGIPLTDDDN